jgi:alanyl-tRNA synthetase
MTSGELREKFLEYFAKNGHTRVPSSSLLPDDPSVLLTTAGMQQFKPYYTGEADPMVSPHPTLGGKPLGSKNVASAQKSFRTSDIDEVGDERHLTFFEMLGNFSFGGYFKEDAIRYAKEYLDSIHISIDYVTVFEGDSSVPRDETSESIWEKYGFSRDKGNLRFENRDENFWGPTGDQGPCGPTTEIYAGGVEIWNIVFNEFFCHSDGKLEKLKTPGVDTGMGLERLAMVSQGKQNVFETDLFLPILELLPAGTEEKIQRIFGDHSRAVAFLLADGVRPSNKEAGYVLRRLLRRILVYEHLRGGIDTEHILEKVLQEYGNFYTELQNEDILEEFRQEKSKFQASVARGLKELERLNLITDKSAFRLYESFGLPYEIVKELGGSKAAALSRKGFDKEFARHQEISRAGQGQKFGGHGLILNTGELKAANQQEVEVVTRLHTATHLLQAALRQVLGDSVRQAGSDITAARTRCDFTFDRKLTEEEKKEVEQTVNKAIQDDLLVRYEEMPYEKAVETNALHFAKEKYPPVVKVYTMDSKYPTPFSQELCGGPHVEHTLEVGTFKIVKEESVAAGIRRIRGVLV